MHLKGWKRYAFDVLGPNGALVSKNRAKMAKIGFTQMAIFWKNISFDLLQNGPKYTSRTNLHFDIDLGKEVHLKFFTTNKIIFWDLAHPLLAEIDKRARGCPGRVQRTLKHFSHV